MWVSQEKDHCSFNVWNILWCEHSSPYCPWWKGFKGLSIASTPYKTCLTRYKRKEYCLYTSVCFSSLKIYILSAIMEEIIKGNETFTVKAHRILLSKVSTPQFSFPIKAFHIVYQSHFPSRQWVGYRLVVLWMEKVISFMERTMKVSQWKKGGK